MNTSEMKRSLLRAGALGAAAALALLAACEAKVPTAAQIEAMDVASVEQSAHQTKMLDEKRLESMTFFVNGVKVSARTAHGIAPNQIATVNVEKGKGDSATIRIVTNGATPKAEAEVDMSTHRQFEAAMHGDAPVGAMKLRTPERDNRMMAGLLFVNGKRVDAATFERLNAADFKTVEITKGAEAVKLYNDPAAVNGVIKVTTN